MEDIFVCAEWFNSVGLVSNIIGVVMVFFFGFPQPDYRAPALLLNGPEHEEEGRQAERKKAAYKRWSKWGLFFLGFGFALQLIATWAPVICG